MTELTLEKYEQNRKFMPPICIVCGKPSVTYVERRYEGINPLVYVLPGPIRNIAVKQHIKYAPSIDLPFCDNHQWHYELRQILYIMIIFLAIPLFLITVFIATSLGENGDRMSQVLLLLLSGLIIFLTYWIGKRITASVIAPTAVKKNGEVTFNCFHQSFVDEFLRRRQMNIDDAIKRSQSP